MIYMMAVKPELIFVVCWIVLDMFVATPLPSVFGGLVNRLCANAKPVQSFETRKIFEVIAFRSRSDYTTAAQKTQSRRKKVLCC